MKSLNMKLVSQFGHLIVDAVQNEQTSVFNVYFVGIWNLSLCTMLLLAPGFNCLTVQWYVIALHR
jgi:hypothetical protein